MKFILAHCKSSAPHGWKRLSILRYFSNVRRALYTTFPTEVAYLKDFMNKYPFLTLGMAFSCGLIVGGILRARVSQFVILALLGGFALATPYGSSLGLPVFLSILLVIPIHAFIAYAAIRIIFAIERYPKAKPYLTKLKKKYRPASEILVAHAGKLGLGGALTICTFLFGWQPTIVIAYLLDVDVSTTMKTIILGALIGAIFFWAVYEGLLKAFPYPILVIAVIVIIFGILGLVIKQIAKQKSK